MADQLQLRRGTTAQIATFTGAQGEIVVDTDKDTIVVQDGATPGGFPLASEAAVVDGTFYFNDDVSGGSIANSYILSPKVNTNIANSYMDGQQYGFVTANANTGPSTATFSALGVRSLKWPGGVDPVAGEISGRVYLIFDATNNWFEIQDIERSIDYLNTTRINVASTGVVDLTTSAPNTRNINITGTTAITAFTVAAGQTYFVRFNAALTLTNNASIVTQSGANITTAAGDTCILRATAANVVEVLAYTPFAYPFLREYESAEQTITAGGLVTLAHTLGAIPRMWSYFYVCKTAEAGYSVGDLLMPAFTPDAGPGAGIYNHVVSADITNIYARCATSGIATVDKSTGGLVIITVAKWRLIVRAWA